MENLDQQIIDLLTAKKRIELAKNHLEKLIPRIDKILQQIRNYESILDQEYEDYQEIEKLNVKSLFLRILGNKEEQLELKRQEYLHAFLQHKDLVKTFELLLFEKGVLEEKIQELTPIEKRLDQLVEIREAKAAALNPALQSSLRAINVQVDDNLQLNREIYEAKIAGIKVKVELEKMINYLKKAAEMENWTITSMQHAEEGKKYVHKAVEIFYEIKQLIYQFEDELEDIYKHRKIDLLIGIDSPEHIAKLYYDNLISDWVIRKRIHHSLFSIESLFDRIARNLQSLNKEKSLADQRLNYLKGRKKELLLEGLK